MRKNNRAENSHQAVRRRERMTVKRILDRAIVNEAL